MKLNRLYILCFLSLFSCHEKKIEVIPLNNNLSITHKRGLFAVNENIIWASGAKGVVMYTENNMDWKKFQDSTWTGLDFRDIHAFNKKEAIVMSSGDGCEMYKTKDGGENWLKIYENNTKGIFFDGMDFWDDKNGVAFSDPIKNKLYIIITKDGGGSWQLLNTILMPSMLNGEAGFAASGTGIVCVGDSSLYIGTGGGVTSRIFISHNRGESWEVVNTLMRSGEASGIYSMVFLDKLNGVAVGGNYLDSASIEGNCIITSDGGKNWRIPQYPPTGYQSCVAYNGNGILVSTGRNGIDVSYDKGNTWQHISDDAYYSCVINGQSGWLTGRGGKMAQINL